MEHNGTKRAFGNGARQQAGSGQGEKGTEPLRVLHGIQFHRVRGAKELRSDGGGLLAGQQGVRYRDAIQLSVDHLYAVDIYA